MRLGDQVWWNEKRWYRGQAAGFDTFCGPVIAADHERGILCAAKRGTFGDFLVISNGYNFYATREQAVAAGTTVD